MKADTPFLRRIHGAMPRGYGVIGATAVLHGPAGRVLNKWRDAVHFNNLSPGAVQPGGAEDGLRTGANRTSR